MKRILTGIQKLYDKKVDASGLAIFRISFYTIFLCEVIQIYYFRQLIFDKIPFVVPADVDFKYALIAWMISILFIIFGLFTKKAALISYLFSLVFIAAIRTYEYHMFYVYMCVGFLMIFLDSSRMYSLDRIRIKLKYSNSRFTYEPPTKISILNYFIPVLLGIAFVYFDSIFFKSGSHNWLTGIGMWLPSSLPQVTHLDTSPILNIKWLSLLLGYLTFAFEAIFLFTFFLKRWRLPLLIIGIGLHIGIFLVFPIPWFGLGVTCLYFLMVPIKYWQCLADKIKFKEHRLLIFYDEECPLCNRTKIILKSLDVFNSLKFQGLQTSGFEHKAVEKIDKQDLLLNIYSVTRSGKLLNGIKTYRKVFLYIPLLFLIGVLLYIPGFYHLARFIYSKIAGNRHVERCTDDSCGYIPPQAPKLHSDDVKLTRKTTLGNLKVRIITAGMILFVLLQLNITYNSLVINNIKERIGFNESRIESNIQRISFPLGKLSKIFFGITHHAVFMDGHFDNYNHVLAVTATDKNTGKEFWLPIINSDGHAGNYIYSFNWVKWTFRVNSPNIQQEQLEIGLRDFLIFWSYKNSINPEDLTFHILLKKIEIPKKWEHDFLKRQKLKPWEKVGTANWNGKEFLISIPVIEEL